MEHLFFHPLVSSPRLAFTPDKLGQGFKDYFIDVREFRRIMPQLYRHGWVLVDIHAVASGPLLVPVGKKPLLLSIDDLNYNGYMRERGTGWRLILDRSGNVQVEERTSDGHRRGSRTQEIVPLLDDFVAAHPDFSLNGAKGVIAETGYEGVLGERTNELHAPDIAARRERVRRLVSRLKATGWTFASHSFGHLDFAHIPLDRAVRDATRWRDEVEPLVGKTDVFIYAFGALAPPSTRVVLTRQFGFRIFCSIDVNPVLQRSGGVVTIARRHIDGFAFDGQRRALKPFFNVADVIDRGARRG